MQEHLVPQVLARACFERVLELATDDKCQVLAQNCLREVEQPERNEVDQHQKPDPVAMPDLPVEKAQGKEVVLFFSGTGLQTIHYSTESLGVHLLGLEKSRELHKIVLKPFVWMFIMCTYVSGYFFSLLSFLPRFRVCYFASPLIQFSPLLLIWPFVNLPFARRVLFTFNTGFVFSNLFIFASALIASYRHSFEVVFVLVCWLPMGVTFAFIDALPPKMRLRVAMYGSFPFVGSIVFVAGGTFLHLFGDLSPTIPNIEERIVFLSINISLYTLRGTFSALASRGMAISPRAPVLGITLPLEEAKQRIAFSAHVVVQSLTRQLAGKTSSQDWQGVFPASLLARRLEQLSALCPPTNIALHAHISFWLDFARHKRPLTPLQPTGTVERSQTNSEDGMRHLFYTSELEFYVDFRENQLGELLFGKNIQRLFRKIGRSKAGIAFIIVTFLCGNILSIMSYFEGMQHLAIYTLLSLPALMIVYPFLNTLLIRRLCASFDTAFYLFNLLGVFYCLLMLFKNASTRMTVFFSSPSLLAIPFLDAMPPKLRLKNSFFANLMPGVCLSVLGTAIATNAIPFEEVLIMSEPSPMFLSNRLLWFLVNVVLMLLKMYVNNQQSDGQALTVLLFQQTNAKLPLSVCRTLEQRNSTRKGTSRFRLTKVMPSFYGNKYLS